jgi:hypothetical protein
MQIQAIPVQSGRVENTTKTRRKLWFSGNRAGSTPGAFDESQGRAV